MQILVVKNIDQGLERAKEQIYKLVDNKTVLFLSGGTTPGPLYAEFAKEGVLKPAVVAMVDERFGPKMHENSNEKMIADTGFLRYLSLTNIPFYPILRDGLSREEAAESYDKKVRDLFFHFPKSVGIMGIGKDGHTAGIPASEISNIKFQMSNKYKFVESYNDQEGAYPERITLTFAGLSLLDYFIVFAFGKERAKAMQNAFTKGPLEEIPARFYTTDDIAKKTLFITDQKI